jgi:hypothetical protein
LKLLGPFTVQMEVQVCYLAFAGSALLASLAVCAAASADVASGVALSISHISSWHSLCTHIYTKILQTAGENCMHLVCMFQDPKPCSHTEKETVPLQQQQQQL